MEKFDYKGTDFNIIETFNASDHEGFNDFEVKKTDRTLVKTIFPIFPILYKRKFRWLKKCRVRYRLFFFRRKDFDDGLTYSYYWSKWMPDFRIEEIIS